LDSCKQRSATLSLSKPHYHRVSTASVPMLYLWVHEQFLKDDFCGVCLRCYKNKELHLQLAHSQAYVCKHCADEDVYFYLPNVAKAHSEAHEISNEDWENSFFVIPTGNLPFLLPLPTNWKDLYPKNVPTFCEICNIFGVEVNHSETYHTTAKQCSVCKTGLFYDGFEVHSAVCPTATEIEINTEDTPVNRLCELCGKKCLDWRQHNELFHGKDCLDLSESATVTVKTEDDEFEIGEDMFEVSLNDTPDTKPNVDGIDDDFKKTEAESVDDCKTIKTEVVTENDE